MCSKSDVIMTQQDTIAFQYRKELCLISLPCCIRVIEPSSVNGHATVTITCAWMLLYYYSLLHVHGRCSSSVLLCDSEIDMRLMPIRIYNHPAITAESH